MRAKNQIAGGTANLGCALHQDDYKNRTGRIACATKADSSLRSE
jgi:hypothetical protein